MGAKVTFLGEPFAKDTLVLGREQVVKGRVWTLKEGRAVLKPVKVVAENPLGYEVEGLAADEPLLVLPGDFKLQEGAKVQVKERG